MSNYNEDQQKASDKILAFIENRDEPFFCLSGSAGTGKTYLISNIAKEFDGEVVLTAPTNKAVSVLENKVSGTPCMTIHTFLGLKPERREDKMILVRKRNYDPSEYSGVRIVGLDEASMTDPLLCKYIKDDVRNWGRKYIFIGDRYQLPPPATEEDYSSLSLAFSMHGGDDSLQHELFKIVRQAKDSPIITVATAVRDAIKADEEPPIRGCKNPYTGEGVFILRDEDFDRGLRHYSALPEFHQSQDFLRILAYRNVTVHKYNKAIRDILGHDIDKPFMPEDIVVVNEAYAPDGEVVINTGAEVTVKSLSITEHPVYDDLKCWNVEIYEAPGIPFFVLHEDSKAAFDKRLDRLKTEAWKSKNWMPYYGLKEFFIDLRPLYSLTVHKSQGSEFSNVFIDVADIYKNRRKSEADRCLYTAITRAKNNVFIRL